MTLDDTKISVRGMTHSEGKKLINKLQKIKNAMKFFIFWSPNVVKENKFLIYHTTSSDKWPKREKNFLRVTIVLDYSI